MVLLFQVVICALATSMAVYAAQVAPSLTTRADTFRRTNVNTQMHRTMDIVAIFVYLLGVGVLFSIGTEVVWVGQNMWHMLELRRGVPVNTQETEGPTKPHSVRNEAR
jgi:hypothetical protein